MSQAKEQTENPQVVVGRAGNGRPTNPMADAPEATREIARVSEDGLSVEIARYVGAEIVELRALDPAQALRQAAALADASAEALRNRARLGLARSIA